MWWGAGFFLLASIVLLVFAIKLSNYDAGFSNTLLTGFVVLLGFAIMFAFGARGQRISANNALLYAHCVTDGGKDYQCRAMFPE